MSALSNGSRESGHSPPEAGEYSCSSDSDSDSSRCQEEPLRLVTRIKCEDVLLDDDSFPSLRCSQSRVTGSVAPASLSCTSRTGNRSSSCSNVCPQNSHVDQDTGNLFGSDHNSVIRKGIANGE